MVIKIFRYIFMQVFIEEMTNYLVINLSWSLGLIIGYFLLKLALL